MAVDFRNILGINEASVYVVSRLERTNRDILKYLSIFLAILTFIAFVTTLFPVVPWTSKPPEILVVYRVGLLAASLLSLLTHIACAFLIKREEDISRKTRLLLILYTAFLLVSAIVVTASDYSSTRTFFLYVIALILIFGLLYIQPVVTICIVIIYTAALTVILAIQGHADATDYILLSLYAFFVIIVSVSSYQTRTRAMLSSEQVHEVSLHDSLTGVKNRRALNEDMSGVLGRSTYLLLGDIDDFKFYNDSFGHDTGDKLLRVLAQSMCDVFGEKNVYRYGGDEFVAVVLEVEESEFLGMVASWRSAFAGVQVEEEQYTPTTSGGFVHGIPGTIEEVQDMLRLADIRLYDAKQAGRNKVLGVEYEGREETAAALDAASLRNRLSGDADALTGLPSMTYFTIHARSLLEASTLRDAKFYIVYFNIENMKAYNERFGMSKGDELLIFTANTIKDNFEYALITRVGDDRFGVLTYNDDPISKIERVYTAVRMHNDEANIPVRAGVYEYEHGVDISAACDFAKLACDYIKGKHNVFYYVYNKDLHEMRERKQFILDRFENALSNGNIQVYYQPILRSLSGRVSEFEALARWEDPDEGIIPTDDFIPVLEDYRLIHLLDMHVIEYVCKDIDDMRRAGGKRPLPVNVNLSRFDIGLCDIVNETLEIMKRYDIPANMLNIEITESAFSENTEQLSKVIQRFHDYGMQVWMDDFGSGYSSLNILREFDFDVVKFDMFFLRSSDEVSLSRSQMMVSHLIDMTKELGVQTLMEGVETQGQFEFLRTAGCEKVQGFIFDIPRPGLIVREMVETGEIKIEHPDERLYYDPIGQVNIASPASIDPELAHSIEMSGGMPAAIVEFRDGRVGYLHWNSSYIDYLEDIGMNTIENSTAQMNDLSREQSQGFFWAAEHFRDKEEWVPLSFYEGKDLCTGMGRRVAFDEESGAVAFLFIAFNITNYLGRAGLTIPEIPSTLS